jgi:single-strand DNA-binding protein
MNKYQIIGNLVRDPETGTTESGVHWCSFTVAARKRRHKDGEPDAEFVRVTAWRGLGDSCAKYLSKGKKVYVDGEPKARPWQSEDGTLRAQIELTAEEVEFLSSKGSGQADDPNERWPEEPECPV